MDLVSLTFVGKTKYFDYYGYTIRRKRKQGGVIDKLEKFKKELEDFRIYLKDGDFLIVRRIEKILIKMYEGDFK